MKRRLILLSEKELQQVRAALVILEPRTTAGTTALQKVERAEQLEQSDVHLWIEAMERAFK